MKDNYDPAGNVSMVKFINTRYYDSGTHFIYVNNNFEEGKAKVLENSVDALKPAVVLTIDDVLVDRFSWYRKFDFAVSASSLEEDKNETNYPVMPNALNLIAWLKSQNVAIFVITERLVSMEDNTKLMLINAGYTLSDFTLISKPDEYVGSTLDFKMSKQAEIVAQDYKIVCNFYGEPYDCDPVHSMWNCKIINPFYLAAECLV